MRRNRRCRQGVRRGDVTLSERCLPMSPGRGTTATTARPCPLPQKSCRETNVPQTDEMRCASKPAAPLHDFGLLCPYVTRTRKPSGKTPSRRHPDIQQKTILSAPTFHVLDSLRHGDRRTRAHHRLSAFRRYSGPTVVPEPSTPLSRFEKSTAAFGPPKRLRRIIESDGRRYDREFRPEKPEEAEKTDR